jgi:nucleoside-diphosphate-sugar epimerase
MDATKLRNMGWQPKISLEEGIMLAYNDFLNGKYRSV